MAYSSNNNSLPPTVQSSESLLFVDQREKVDIPEAKIYKSIANAIKQANPGDRIIIKNGTYQEDFEISKNLVLEGEEETQVTVRCTRGLKLRADKIVIRNISVESAAEQCILVAGGGTFVIESCIFFCDVDGIRIKDKSHSVTIRNNRFTQRKQYDQRAKSSAILAALNECQLTELTVESNIISNYHTGIGISTENIKTCNISENDIEHCTLGAISKYNGERNTLHHNIIALVGQKWDANDFNNNACDRSPEGEYDVILDVMRALRKNNNKPMLMSDIGNILAGNPKVQAVR
jgi:nitrous oxidase accessory protein NosD